MMGRIGQLVALLLAAAAFLLVLLLPRQGVENAAVGHGALFLFSLFTGVFPGPTTAAVFLAGDILNPLIAALVAAVGSTMGESTSYAAGFGSHAIVEDLSNSSRRLERFGWYRRMAKWTESHISTHPFLTIFLVGAVPNPFMDLTGFAAGRVGYAFWRFIAAILLGKIVRFIAVAFLGAWTL